MKHISKEYIEYAKKHLVSHLAKAGVEMSQEEINAINAKIDAVVSQHSDEKTCAICGDPLKTDKDKQAGVCTHCRRYVRS